MSDNVVFLPGVNIEVTPEEPGETEPNPRIVELLEKTLEEAKSGEVRDIAIAGVSQTKEGPVLFYRWYGEEEYGSLAGSVAGLAFDLQWQRFKEMDED